jgi:hypothetical protein
MGEGKLFLFHFKKRQSHDSGETKKVWLCENCFENWVVTLDEEGRVELSPRQQKPSYVSPSRFAASQRNKPSIFRRAA